MAEYTHKPVKIPPPKVDKTKRIGRWYFGGLASAGAACCTHPLDLLKVEHSVVCHDINYNTNRMYAVPVIINIITNSS